MRARETVLLGLIARRSVAICVASSSSLKTGRAAMVVVTEEAKEDGDRRDTSCAVGRTPTKFKWGLRYVLRCGRLPA